MIPAIIGLVTAMASKKKDVQQPNIGDVFNPGQVDLTKQKQQQHTQFGQQTWHP